MKKNEETMNQKTGKNVSGKGGKSVSGKGGKSVSGKGRKTAATSGKQSGTRRERHERRNATARKRMRAYFEQCDAEGKKYTYPGLQVALGVDGKTLEEWSRDKYLGPDIELARAKVRDALEQREDQMAVYLRRQDSAAGAAEALGLVVYFEEPEDLKRYGE